MSAATAIRIAMLACLLDCGGDCPGFSSPAFEITVTDVTSARLCDAAVTAEGPDTVTLQLVPAADGECVFEDSGRVKGGTYDITASAPGHAAGTLTAIHVGQDACGHDGETQRLAIVLGF